MKVSRGESEQKFSQYAVKAPNQKFRSKARASLEEQVLIVIFYAKSSNVQGSIATNIFPSLNNEAVSQDFQSRSLEHASANLNA